MKNRIKLLSQLCVAAIITGVVFTMAGCGDNPGNDPYRDPQPTIQPTTRYVTVPVGSAGYRQSVSRSIKRSVEESDSYVLVNSGKTATDHYYLYYLGYVKSVPIAYKTSYIYNGKTPITIMFEKTWATEETITESMTKAKESTWSVHASITAGVEVSGGASIPLLAEGKVKASISGTVGGGYGESVSTSNTLESSRTFITGETESITSTIGEHGEAPGKYRYALFGITDVYCLFVVNPTTRAIKETTITNCARVSSYGWGIDFEPNEMGTFGKTGEGDLFIIPDVDFTQIPAPTETIAENPGPGENQVAKPAASPNGGTFINSATVTLTSATPGAEIRYTTNGDTPTKSSGTYYSGSFQITKEGSTTVKAIAYKTGMTDSEILSTTFTITPPPLKTTLVLKWNDGGSILVTDANSDKGARTWQQMGGTDGLELGALRDAGYTTVTVQASYDVQSVKDAWINFFILSGHNNIEDWDQNISSNEIWGRWWEKGKTSDGDKADDIPEDNQWHTLTHTSKPIALTGLNSPGNFTLFWDASGNGTNSFNLGTVTITVTASK